MILQPGTVDIVEQHVVLILCDPQNSFGETFVEIDTPPAGNGYLRIRLDFMCGSRLLTIRSDDWVDRSQMIALVQWMASFPVRSNLDAQSRGFAVEKFGRVFGFQGSEIILHGRGHLLEQIVGVDPHGIATGRGKSVDLQHGVITAAELVSLGSSLVSHREPRTMGRFQS